MPTQNSAPTLFSGSENAVATTAPGPRGAKALDTRPKSPAPASLVEGHLPARSSGISDRDVEILTRSQEFVKLLSSQSSKWDTDLARCVIDSVLDNPRSKTAEIDGKKFGITRAALSTATTLFLLIPSPGPLFDTLPNKKIERVGQLLHSFALNGVIFSIQDRVLLGHFPPAILIGLADAFDGALLSHFKDHNAPELKNLVVQLQTLLFDRTYNTQASTRYYALTAAQTPKSPAYADAQRKATSYLNNRDVQSIKSELSKMKKWLEPHEEKDLSSMGNERIAYQALRALLAIATKGSDSLRQQVLERNDQLAHAFGIVTAYAEVAELSKIIGS